MSLNHGVRQDDIPYVLTRLRARDSRELEECGFDVAQASTALTAASVLVGIFHKDAAAAAVVAFHQLTPKALAVSLLATEDWPHVARDVFRWGVREARPRLLAMGYERAECRTMEGHDDAVALLERFGFVKECRLDRYGASGIAFWQYAWRLGDHAARFQRNLNSISTSVDSV